MNQMNLLWIAAGMSVVAVVLLAVVLRKLYEEKREGLERALRDEFRFGRKESSQAAQALREEVAQSQKDSNNTIIKVIGTLTASNETKLEKLRETLESQIKQLQQSNERKLDQMRETVDEKLQSTLEKRLGESFKLVSERLEAVQKGLGEMKNLADDVGGLQRVLTNVKSRGTWGEVQLGALLEQTLTPDQYAKNVECIPGSGQRVEFAIKLPGNKTDNTPLWLPIDSKFPREDYDRLIDAAQQADKEGVDKALKGLTRAVEQSAKDISGKYLSPPDTTDFAIMFMPTEGLYSEVVKRPGLVTRLQNKYRVMVAGPTTIAATLNSFRLGFRTLAIQQRSSEVWKVLAGVKSEFGKFGESLRKVKRQLDTASKTIETDMGVRTRAIERRLSGVEQLSGGNQESMLEAPDLDEEKDEADSDED